jgi:hypothetical protein
MHDDVPPHRPPDKLQVEHGAETAAEAAETREAGSGAEALEAAMAEMIRSEARERSAMTLAETVFAAVPAPWKGQITAMLEEMAADPRYADIKAVTTASGKVFFFSKDHIREDEAFPRSRIEEAKSLLADKVRADSREREALTPEGDLHGLSPDTAPGKIEAVLAEMEADERYVDIRRISAAGGAVFFHSDRHLSGGYAVLLIRAAGNDRCATVVETVREDSRIYPRPTNTRIFEQPVFGIGASELEGVIEEILGRAEFTDIRRLVHPDTGRVYLYSDRHLTQAHAFALMDWEEVGKDNSP